MEKVFKLCELAAISLVVLSELGMLISSIVLGWTSEFTVLMAVVLVVSILSLKAICNEK